MQFHRIKMRYSIEPRDRIYEKGYGFFSFAKNMVKNLSNKHGQNKKNLKNFKNAKRNLQQMQ